MRDVEGVSDRRNSVFRVWRPQGCNSEALETQSGGGSVEGMHGEPEA